MRLPFLRTAILTAATALLAVLLLRPAVAHGDSTLFEYKFPCVPQDDCYVTTLAHVGDALDFDPQGSAGLGDIVSVSEATFDQYITQSTICTTSGLGKYAVMNDMFGRTLRYAHLSQFGSLVHDHRVLQGDLVGVEGNTGHTENCAPHLHLEGIATAPGIDGIPMSSITAGPTLYKSTNSEAGARSPFSGQPSADVIRQYYLGSGSSSWAIVGWTADWTGNDGGCGWVIFCQLYVHYSPDPLAGHWGSAQTFRLGNGTPAVDDNAIMVGRWAVNNAYRVTRGFFLQWLLGYQAIGLPMTDQFTYPGLCPQSLGCVAYQKFSFGYMWQHATQGVEPAVFCPDVDNNDNNYMVDIADITAEVAHYFESDALLQPYEPWPAARYDVDGDGLMTISDIYTVVGHYYQLCYPT